MWLTKLLIVIEMQKLNKVLFKAQICGKYFVVKLFIWIWFFISNTRHSDSVFVRKEGVAFVVHANSHVSAKWWFFLTHCDLQISLHDNSWLDDPWDWIMNFWFMSYHLVVAKRAMKFTERELKYSSFNAYFCDFKSCHVPWDTVSDHTPWKVIIWKKRMLKVDTSIFFVWFASLWTPEEYIGKTIGNYINKKTDFIQWVFNGLNKHICSRASQNQRYLLI